MLTEPILTLAVALAIPLWLAIEEVLQRKRRRQVERRQAEHGAPQFHRPAKAA